VRKRERERETEFQLKQNCFASATKFALSSVHETKENNKKA